MAPPGTRSMFDLTGKLALVTGCRAASDWQWWRRKRGRRRHRRRKSAARARDRATYSARGGGGTLLHRVPRRLRRSGCGSRVRSGRRSRRSHGRYPRQQCGDDRSLGGEWTTATTDGTTRREVDLTAPFVLTRELGKGMVERGSGKVIFTASLLSFQGGIRVPSYTAAKSGIAGLVRAFSNEWAGLGVNVNGIAPGYVETDNTRALRNDPDRYESLLERIPAGRWGQPRGFRRRHGLSRLARRRLRVRDDHPGRRWLAGTMSFPLDLQQRFFVGNRLAVAEPRFVRCFYAASTLTRRFLNRVRKFDSCRGHRSSLEPSSAAARR